MKAGGEEERGWGGPAPPRPGQNLKASQQSGGGCHSLPSSCRSADASRPSGWDLRGWLGRGCPSPRWWCHCRPQTAINSLEKLSLPPKHPWLLRGRAWEPHLPEPDGAVPSPPSRRMASLSAGIPLPSLQEESQPPAPRNRCPLPSRGGVVTVQLAAGTALQGTLPAITSSRVGNCKARSLAVGVS